jgi:electron transfer flavoprotein alpha subunit
MGDVLVVAEQTEDVLRSTTFEGLGVASRLAERTEGSACAVLVGIGSEDLTQSLAAYGATKVYLVDDASLHTYSQEGHTAAIVRVIEKASPDVVLFTASTRGKELSARVAARMRVAIAPDCIDVAYEDGLVVTRPVYAGKIVSKVKLVGERPHVVSLRPKIFAAPEKSTEAAAEVIRVEAGIDPAVIRARVKKFLKPETEFADVTEADVIVSGGRGLKDRSNFVMLEELARMLGGSVGASRAAVDAEWRDHADQVGQTGKIVNPNLYVACGISGAIQHLVGMRTAKCIVAINKDPEAPIFKVADYGVVGDLFEVVPMLKEELGKECS